MERRACASATKVRTRAAASSSGCSRSAASNQRAAVAGARGAVMVAASIRTAIAAVALTAERSTWWAREAADAPRAASAGRARVRDSRQPPPVDS